MHICQNPRFVPGMRRSTQRFALCLPSRHATSKHYHPAPSQIVRYALRGTTMQKDLDMELKRVFKSPNPILPPLWALPHPPHRLGPSDLQGGKGGLRRLRLTIERGLNNAKDAQFLLQNGENFLAQALKSSYLTASPTEVVSTLHAIITRMQDLQRPVPKELHFLGMFFACLYYIPSALKWHLESYAASTSEALQPDSSAALVNALRYALQLRKARSPKCDITIMRGLVTGENHRGPHSQPSLHKLLCWNQPNRPSEFLGHYLSLLVMLDSKAVLREVWLRTVNGPLSGDKTSRFHSAYPCVAALIRAGKTKKAKAFLEQLSKRGHGTLPGLSEFRDISSLLEVSIIENDLKELAGPREYLRIIQYQLGHLEKRLGIRWDSENSHHTSISNPLDIVTEKPLFSIDGDCEAYASSERLAAEIQALGYMRSWRNLGKIGELLEEYEGTHVPVRLKTNPCGRNDFFWVLERCPVKLPGSKTTLSTTMMPRAWTMSTLGLIRVRPTGYSQPIQEQQLLLMGLGYLVVRQTLEDGTTHLAETGHIVAWDRIFSQFLIVQTRDRNKPNHHQNLLKPLLLPELGDIVRVEPRGCSVHEELPTPFLGCQNQNFLFDIHAGPGISP